MFESCLQDPSGWAMLPVGVPGSTGFSAIPTWPFLQGALHAVQVSQGLNGVDVILGIYSTIARAFK